MFVNEKTLLVRYQPEQRAFIPICGSSAYPLDQRHLSHRVGGWLILQQFLGDRLLFSGKFL
jgi:hypothetical protein